MSYKSISIINIALLFVISCTPKVAPVVVEQPKEVKPKYEGPCATFDDLTPAEKDEAETSYVLYKDFIRTKSFDEAYSYWSRAMELAPKSNGRIQYQFEDGLVIYKHFFDNETNEEKKKEWMEKFMGLYDHRVECFGEEAYVAGRKGYDMYYNFNSYFDEDEIYALFKQSIDGLGIETGYFVVNPFTKLLVERLVNEEIDKEEGRKYANLLFDIIENGIAKCEENKNCAAWEIINGYAPARLEALEGYEDFYDCTYYTDKYYQEFLDNPEDCEVIVNVFAKLNRGNCDDSSEALAAVSEARLNLCMKKQEVVEPGPLRRAYDAYNEGKYRDAVTLFEEFVKNTDDFEKKAKYSLLVAKIYYRDLKNFSLSRKYALEAASYKSGWGEPYMLIGKLYASSGPLCGPGTGWDSQVVTWPAIDKWEYARSIDSSVAAEANQLIRTYSQYMPKKEDVFVRTSIKVGDSFRVNCWIQETTRVRTAD